MDRIPSRIEIIRKFKEDGGSIAAVLPIHYSRSLLRAFGFLPVEVWGAPQIGAGKSSAHLQAYVCSICHNALSYLQQGGLDLADLVLVPHACDSLQGLGSLLQFCVDKLRCLGRSQVDGLMLAHAGSITKIRLEAKRMRLNEQRTSPAATLPVSNSTGAP